MSVKQEVQTPSSRQVLQFPTESHFLQSPEDFSMKWVLLGHWQLPKELTQKNPSAHLTH
jgi:hypothetical protein